METDVILAIIAAIAGVAIWVTLFEVVYHFRYQRERFITVKILTDEIDEFVIDMPVVMGIESEKGELYLKLKNKKAMRWIVNRLINRGILEEISEEEFQRRENKIFQR